MYYFVCNAHEIFDKRVCNVLLGFLKIEFKIIKQNLVKFRDYTLSLAEKTQLCVQVMGVLYMYIKDHRRQRREGYYERAISKTNSGDMISRKQNKQ